MNLRETNCKTVCWKIYYNIEGAMKSEVVKQLLLYRQNSENSFEQINTYGYFCVFK